MISEEIMIREEREMDARQIALLVQRAGEFRSDCYMEKNGMKVNAKSLMGTMAVRMCGGESVKVSCNGEDEKEALASLKAFLIA